MLGFWQETNKLVMEQASSRVHTPGGYTQDLRQSKHQHSIYVNICIKSTFFQRGCIANTRLPGNLEGVQGTEFGTYPCLVATTTEGVPRR